MGAARLRRLLDGVGFSVYAFGKRRVRERDDGD
jgi:hypothetical protein